VCHQSPPKNVKEESSVTLSISEPKESFRRQRRFFVQRDDAERFVAKHTTTPIPIGELWGRKAEILYALERLRPFGTNLTDAVKIYPRGLSDIHAGPFYRRNGLSPGGHVSIGSWGGG
jgi:hypothetical protein